MTKPTAIAKKGKAKKTSDSIKGDIETVKNKTATPAVILPSYMSNQNKKTNPPLPRYLPESNRLLGEHEKSLGAYNINPTPNSADSILTANYLTEDEVQFMEVSASIAGESGAIQMHDTFIFDPTAAPADVLLFPEQRNLPPDLERSNPYPIQFYFKREISYADKKGRILQMEFVATMGFTTENFRRQAGVILDDTQNQWYRLSFMQADEASATFFVDGRGLTEEPYFTFASADGASIRFDELYQALYGGGNDMNEFDLGILLPPDSGVGLQFSALRSWLNRVDEARWKKAHPPKAWYEEVGSFALGAGKSVYNNTVGAVYQAGLQLADMERLWVAVAMKKLGVVDYTPSMWSDMGKAAEQGATTKDLLVGMGKGMVMAPYRFVKAVQRGDSEAAGEALVDTAFAVEGARGTVKAVPSILRAGKRGFGKLRTAIPSLKAGLRDFHMNLRGKGSAAALRDLPDTYANQYRHSMAGSVNSPDIYSPPEVYGPITPEQARLDTAHYDWIDQMHAATLGKGPEPAPWSGPTPRFDAKGRWTGWDPAEAYAAYRAGIEGNRGVFEVIIARDRMNGQYEVMLGDRGGVDPSANLDGRFWDTVMHYHPNAEAAPRFTLPAGKDMGTASSAALNAPLGDGRPHIEFVESTLNGQTTRAAIVMGGKDNMCRLDLGSGVLGRDPAAGSLSLPYRGPSDYQKFWWQQNPGKRPQSYPDEKLWVPPDTQAYRNMMIEAAETIGNKTYAQELKNAAPEAGGSPLTTRTQSGQILDAVAPKKPLTKREIINQSPPGSAYHSLKDFGLPPRFTNAIGDDEGADLASMSMVQGSDQLREIMKKSRLAGGFSSNGGALDPTQDMGGQTYWLVLQGEKGKLWLVPSYLLDKKPGVN